MGSKDGGLHYVCSLVAVINWMPYTTNVAGGATKWYNINKSKASKKNNDVIL